MQNIIIKYEGGENFPPKSQKDRTGNSELAYYTVKIKDQCSIESQMNLSSLDIDVIKLFQRFTEDIEGLRRSRP